MRQTIVRERRLRSRSRPAPGRHRVYFLTCPSSPMTPHKVHGQNSNGNLENGPQSAEPGLAQGDVAAVNTGDVAGDGEAKTRRFGILVARVIKPVEGAEHLIALILRDAWPVVLDLDHERAILTSSADRDVVGEAHRIVDEIGDGALEGVASERHDQRRIANVDANVRLAMSLVAHLGQDLVDVGAHDLLA